MDFVRIIKRTLFSILLVLMAALMILQMPSVQESIAAKAIEVLEENFDADFNLESIRFKFINTLIVKDLTVIDRYPVCERAADTLLEVGTLTARFSLGSLFGLSHDDIVLKEVQLTDSRMNLVIDSTIYRNNIIRCFRLPVDAPVKPMPDREILAIRKISVRNFSFNMQNFENVLSGFPPTAICWSDLKACGIDIDARDFTIGYGYFKGTVDHLNLREKSGWVLKHLSGSTVTGKGKVIIKDIVIDDGLSYAELDFNMTGTSRDYLDFVNKVRLEADIRSSRWSLATLSHFIPPMTHPSPDEYFTVRGKASGPVCDLQAHDMHVALEKSSTALVLNGGVANLPDVNGMFIRAAVRDLKFRFDDVGRILKAVSNTSSLDLSTMGSGELYSGTLDVAGNINGLKVKGGVSQTKGNGKAGFSASVDNALKFNVIPISIQGRFQAGELDLGRILGKELFGKTSATASFRLATPVEGQSPLLAAIDSIRVSKASIGGYDYTEISGKAVLKGDSLTACFVSKDPCFDASLDIQTDKDEYIGTLNVNHADICAMNIDRRDSGVVRFASRGRISKDLRFISGNADLYDILMTNSTGAHRVPRLNISASQKDGQQHYSLQSALADAIITKTGGKYNAGIDFSDTREILAFVLPGLYIAKGSRIDVSMDSTGVVSGVVKSSRIAFNNRFAKDVEASIGGTTDSLRAVVTASTVMMTEYGMDNARIDATWTTDRIRADYAFSNTGADDNDGKGNLIDGHLSAEASFGKDSTIISINPSFLNTTLNNWKFGQSAIGINGKNVTVDNFTLSSNSQRIFIDGRTSEHSAEKMKAEVRNFDISILNTILKKENLGLKGRMTADAVLISPVSKGHLPGLYMALDADSVSLSGVPLGKIRAQSILDRESDKFKFRLVDSIGSVEAIKTGVVFSPASDEVEIVGVLDKFPIAGLKGLMSEVFSDMGGEVSGKFKACGPIRNMEISSSGTRIDNGMLKVSYTKVPYLFEGDFDIDNTGIHASRMKMRDTHEGTGSIYGGLNWNRMKDLALDISLNVNNVEAINITPADNDLFSGNIFASGRVSIGGPFKAVELSAACKTEQNSKLHVSLSSAVDAAKQGLLTFVDPGQVKEEDPYQALLDKYYKKHTAEKSNFTLNIMADVDPAMLVSLDLGDVGFAAGMSGRGNGTIGMMIDPSAEQGFQMYGDYTLTEGKFNVNAASVVRRAFNISSGSSIKFTGDVMKSSVDIDATYQTKASLATLIADTTSVSSRRLVNCGIKVQNSLVAPDVKFSINVPDLEPTVQSAVESALSTEDKVQKQFLSLLLSNNFLPDEQSGIVNNASLLYANVSELMAGQINNIFSRLDIPLDLGLNYQPSDRGTDIFDVALSTQLFNNRVVIGGSLGNRQNTGSGGGSLVGDLDVEVKIDKSGTLRLSLFSHSADQYTQYLDNSQRNGIGVSWQQDFDNFARWLGSLFTPRRKKSLPEVQDISGTEKRNTLIIYE